MADLRQCGRFFTWTNKQDGERRVFSQIDRILVNEGWRTQFENAMVHFMPEGDYDHCPGMVCVHKDQQGRKPFRFFNMWTTATDYTRVVSRVWDMQVRGCPMYRVTQKLKQLKLELKWLNKQGFSDIQVNAYQAEQQMLQAQEQMHRNLGDSSLVDAEKKATECYKKAQAMYVSFLKQKAKDRWICLGDENTKLFHQSIKARRTQNKIYAIQDSQGKWVYEGKEVDDAFVKYYKELLGVNMGDRCGVKAQIIQKGAVLIDEQQELLKCNFSDDEIK